jgi:hypothetical protein
MAEWTGLEPATPGVTGRYSNQLNYHSAASWPLKDIWGKTLTGYRPLSAKKEKGVIMTPFPVLAERTGLEPATPGVTGRYSNQLNYRSNMVGAERLELPTFAL